MAPFRASYVQHITWVNSRYCNNILVIVCRCSCFVKVQKYWIFRDHKARNMPSRQRYLQFILIGSQQKQVSCSVHCVPKNETHIILNILYSFN